MTKSKLKKGDLIDSLIDIIDDRHWDIISQLVGRSLDRSPKAKRNFLSKTFKKTIGISSRKGKARTLQKWVCEQISELTGIPWGKDEEIESRPMGSSGPDIIMSKRVRGLFSYSIECKNQETWKIENYIKQAKSNCYPDTDWLLVVSKNDHEELVIMNALSFFKYLKAKNKA